MELKLMDNGKPVNMIDFGVSEAGLTNVRILQLHNSSKYYVIENIQLNKSEDVDYNVVYPKTLKQNETKDVIITWSPKLERRTPLNVSHVFTGDLIID